MNELGSCWLHSAGSSPTSLHNHGCPYWVLSHPQYPEFKTHTFPTLSAGSCMCFLEQQQEQASVDRKGTQKIGKDVQTRKKTQNWTIVLYSGKQKGGFVQCVIKTRERVKASKFFHKKKKRGIDIPIQRHWKPQLITPMKRIPHQRQLAKI